MPKGLFAPGQLIDISNVNYFSVVSLLGYPDHGLAYRTCIRDNTFKSFQYKIKGFENSIEDVVCFGAGFNALQGLDIAGPEYISLLKGH